MSGFMSSSTALMVCKTDSPASLDLDALRVSSRKEKPE